MKRQLLIGAAVVMVAVAGWCWKEYRYQTAQEACVVAVFEDHAGDYRQYRPCMVRKGYELETLDLMLSRKTSAARKLRVAVENAKREREAEEARIAESLRQEAEARRAADEERQKAYEERRRLYAARQNAIELKTAKFVEEANTYPLGFDFQVPYKLLIKQIIDVLYQSAQKMNRQTFVDDVLVNSQNSYAYRRLVAKWEDADPHDVFVFITRGSGSSYAKGEQHFKGCMKAQVIFKERFLDALEKSFKMLANEIDAERKSLKSSMIDCKAAEY